MSVFIRKQRSSTSSSPALLPGCPPTCRLPGRLPQTPKDEEVVVRFLDHFLSADHFFLHLLCASRVRLRRSQRTSYETLPVSPPAASEPRQEGEKNQLEKRKNHHQGREKIGISLFSVYVSRIRRKILNAQKSPLGLTGTKSMIKVWLLTFDATEEERSESFSLLLGRALQCI